MRFNSDAELYRIIGANIKHYREQAKLTQVQLAERADVYANLNLGHMAH